MQPISQETSHVLASIFKVVSLVPREKYGLKTGRGSLRLICS